MLEKMPWWLTQKAPREEDLLAMKEIYAGLGLHTVCEEADCPNVGTCFARKTATVMILGDTCTRNCTFCAVKHGKPAIPDEDEPAKVVELVKRLGLRHVVITSVTRDDLPDGGAGQFAATVQAVSQAIPGVTTEVLIPDFQGSYAALKAVVGAAPTVVNHNLETVPQLYDRVRPQANYDRSLALLQLVKELDARVVTKSGLMLGLGEREDEVLKVMEDLRTVGCDILTVGQYLAPSPFHHPVVEYLPPEVFQFYREKGMAMGFRYVAASPLVRSSYHAAEALQAF